MRVTLLALAAALLAWPLGLGAQAPASSAPVATVNGRVITSEAVDSAVAQSLSTLEMEIYKLRLAKLEALIEEQLIEAEAQARGISVSALLEAEVTAKSRPVTDEEIAIFYGANQARMQGKDFSAWRPEIRTFLIEQRSTERRQAFGKELRSRGRVEVFLKEPAAFHADVPVGNAFSRGNAAAPVTIVEYGDFHCPFCKQAQQVVSQILTRYGDKVRLVYKDFPLDALHPQARAAAEAARCAGAQGKFWEFHDKVYAGASDSSALLMTRYAREVGVADIAQFDACVSARTYRTQVEADVAEGSKLGVTGTPSFFINGRLLAGAQPLENFAGVIDSELKRQAER